MNLTKCFIASLCLTALTASAGFIKTNSFDDGTFGEGGWAGPGLSPSTSILTNLSTGLPDANTPMVIGSDTRVLALNTEGATWTNTVNASFAGTTNIYVDMLVKFVSSETLPTLVAADGKLALAITPNAGGTNYLNIANNDISTFTWVPTTQEISTSAWHRVTVKLYEESSWTYASVYIDNSPVGSAIILNGQKTLNAIGFQGTGFIDEVVVRDDPPFLDTPGVMLTLSFATGIETVIVGGSSKTNGALIATPSTLDITTKTFYEIADVTGATTNWTVPGIGETSGSVTVSSTSNVTVTITARAETSTNAWGGATAFTNQPANKVAAWAITNSLTSLDDTYYNNYLLNVSTNSLPTLLINSIAVSNTTATVTIGAGTVDFTAINGTLKLSALPVLGGTPTNYPATIISGTTNVTVTQNIDTNKFIQAIVE